MPDVAKLVYIGGIIGSFDFLPKNRIYNCCCSLSTGVKILIDNSFEIPKNIKLTNNYAYFPPIQFQGFREECFITLDEYRNRKIDELLNEKDILVNL
jgi:hypothetical protein